MKNLKFAISNNSKYNLLVGMIVADIILIDKIIVPIGLLLTNRNW